MLTRDKVAVVTGAASGIGRALARELSRRGCRLVLADLDGDRLTAAAAVCEGPTLTAVCDVSDHAAVETLADRAWERYGTVDAVFNNAGVAATGPLLQSRGEDFDWLLRVNVLGVYNGCTVFGRRLAARDEPGWIVNTASEHALGFAHAGQGLYTTTKHAVLGFSDVLRHELPDHVGVSVFCPGLVQSDLWDAGRTRPHRADDNSEARALGQRIMMAGMPADEAVKRALDGIEAEQFFVVTHPSSRAIADRRHTEIAAAFDDQAPWTADGDRYDVRRVIRSVLERAPTDAHDPSV